MKSVLSGREVPESLKLQGASNYALWSYKIRTILQGKKLWSVVDPDITLAVGTPWPAADSGDSNSINKATIAASTQQQLHGLLYQPEQPPHHLHHYQRIKVMRI
jgi:hypothetical protein